MLQIRTIWIFTKSIDVLIQSYRWLGSDAPFLWSVQIKGSDLTLDLAIESGFPELLVGPDGMILNAGVGKLVHPGSQFLKDKNVVHKVRTM